MSLGGKPTRKGDIPIKASYGYLSLALEFTGLHNLGLRKANPYCKDLLSDY